MLKVLTFGNFIQHSNQLCYSIFWRLTPVEVPLNWIPKVGKEVNSFEKFLKREEERVAYFEARRTELAEDLVICKSYYFATSLRASFQIIHARFLISIPEPKFSDLAYLVYFDPLAF